MIEEWFGSGAALNLAGVKGLRPREHAHLGIPVAIAKGQATNYLLIDDSGGSWFLKRFLVGMRPASDYVDHTGALIPQRSEFSSGWRRVVVAPSLVQADVGTTLPAGLPEWLDGTVLAPKTPGIQWTDWIADMTTVPLEAAVRVAMARDVARLVAILEACGISHRDLSGGNVLVNSTSVALIDWDTLFSSELQVQSNSPRGSLGYMAPWIRDAPDSWCMGADRFALAILVAEALTVEPGVALQGDGSLFRQEDLAGGAAPSRVLAAIGDISPTLRDMFEMAWRAGRFEDCPSGVDWSEALGSSDVRQEMQSVTALHSALRRGSLTDAMNLLSDTKMESYLSAEAVQRLDSLSRSIDSLKDALASGNRAVLAMLARDGLVDRGALRASARVELDQAVRITGALDALRDAIGSGNPAEVQGARRAAFQAGAAISPSLREAMSRAARMYPLPSPPGPPPNHPPHEDPEFVPFDPDGIPSPPRMEPTPQSMQREMEQHVDRGEWSEACAVWYRLRALWPEEAAAVSAVGDLARRTWGAQLTARELN